MRCCCSCSGTGGSAAEGCCTCVGCRVLRAAILCPARLKKAQSLWQLTAEPGELPGAGIWLLALDLGARGSIWSLFWRAALRCSDCSVCLLGSARCVQHDLAGSIEVVWGAAVLQQHAAYALLSCGAVACVSVSGWLQVPCLAECLLHERSAASGILKSIGLGMHGVCSLHCHLFVAFSSCQLLHTQPTGHSFACEVCVRVLSGSGLC